MNLGKKAAANQFEYHSLDFTKRIESHFDWESMGAALLSVTRSTTVIGI